MTSLETMLVHFSLERKYMKNKSFDVTYKIKRIYF